jgi:cbb3-type cytochrome oxidase subunit 1
MLFPAFTFQSSFSWAAFGFMASVHTLAVIEAHSRKPIIASNNDYRGSQGRLSSSIHNFPDQKTPTQWP